MVLGQIDGLELSQVGLIGPDPGLDDLFVSAHIAAGVHAVAVALAHILIGDILLSGGEVHLGHIGAVGAGHAVAWPRVVRTCQDDVRLIQEGRVRARLGRNSSFGRSSA